MDTAILIGVLVLLTIASGATGLAVAPALVRTEPCPDSALVRRFIDGLMDAMRGRAPIDADKLAAIAGPDPARAGPTLVWLSALGASFGGVIAWLLGAVAPTPILMTLASLLACVGAGGLAFELTFAKAGRVQHPVFGRLVETALAGLATGESPAVIESRLLIVAGLGPATADARRQAA